ncbi:hypothetical protein BRC99_00130 [Halobacteriales archaeon QS_7_69_60]|nr:MAG: hypothetical protein BRC99_00130 [Halobacteriales archaeon QS_7_69_60]
MRVCRHITGMDEIPDRLRVAVGDEPAIETIDIGGGDALVVTPEETYLYRSEGLLSDESVTAYPHDVDRFAVESGRRKNAIVLESFDSEREFTVPAGVTDVVVAAMLEGVLRTTGVVDPDEAVRAQFRFSDLTLVVTEEKLFKHVGPSVWNEDFEMFDYDSLTDLDFEEGSVATQVVVEVQGRQHRVKVPNEQAGRVQRAVQSAVFEHHGVSSLGGLREEVGTEEPESGSEPGSAGPGAVSDPSPEMDSEMDSGTDDSGGVDWSPPADQGVTDPRSRPTGPEADAHSAAVGDRTAGRAADAGGDAAGTDTESLKKRVETLEAQLERQNDLLESQGETIEQLVEELRRGR